MIAAWMVWATGFGLLLYGAAWGLERTLSLLRRPARFAWTVALIGAFAAPVALAARWLLLDSAGERLLWSRRGPVQLPPTASAIAGGFGVAAEAIGNWSTAEIHRPGLDVGMVIATVRNAEAGERIVRSRMQRGLAPDEMRLGQLLVMRTLDRYPELRQMAPSDTAFLWVVGDSAGNVLRTGRDSTRDYNTIRREDGSMSRALGNFGFRGMVAGYINVLVMRRN